jgi:hypothetical protein
MRVIGIECVTFGAYQIVIELIMLIASTYSVDADVVVEKIHY